MARELNNDFLLPLTASFPAARLGAKGDVAKVNCATCHQGAYKPLSGAPMAKEHPELLTVAKPAVAASAAASEVKPTAAMAAGVQTASLK
jgi:photosynthetic reaction center cytochrome c subunit